ncbi:MAG: hypothetical protein JWR30_98 [Conexibacter sp.]|nr:hypothetical protein [Conexibacter sp.]
MGGAAALGVVVTLAGCGSDNANRYGTFTDCAKIGPVATVHDPAGDQRGRLAGKPAQPQGDLVRLRVARRGGKLCAEFRAAAPIKPSVAYVLAMRPRDAETPIAQLELTVLAAQNPGALLQARAGDAFRKLGGSVGIRDDRISVLVDRAPFAAQGLGALFDAFRYQGRAAAVTTDGGRQTDCLPACR